MEDRAPPTRRKNANSKILSVRNRLAFLTAFTFLLLCSSRSFRLSPDHHHEGATSTSNKRPSDEQNSVRTSAARPHSNRQTQPVLFPRWDFDNHQRDDDDDLCSLLSNIVDFAHGLLAGRATTVDQDRPKTRSRWPEILYVLDRKGVWVSRAIRNRSWKMGLSRVVSVEAMLQYAWTALVLSEEHSLSSNPWPTLKESLAHEGMPFFLWYGDYTSCNRDNWIMATTCTTTSTRTSVDDHRQTTHRSIPLLTASAPVNCTHAFPFPNYGTLNILQEDAAHWDRYLFEQNANYPWESKIRQVVWRGSLSAPNDDLQSVRWRLCRLVTDLPFNSSKDKDAARLFDVGLVEIPSRHDHLHLNASLVGGLKQAIRPMEAFQQYLAILDVDGNSWSSRFATLLCSSSIVLKVEPMHVEYFYAELQPWTHYIPIRSDLSDLVEHVRFVLDGRNEATVHAIIQNANDWCRTRLTHNATATVMLNILESYATTLSSSSSSRRNSGSWVDQWQQAKSGIFVGGDAFQMSLLQQPRD